jgi:D-alanyl-lipoteichoic acid acyltransferase DltB (MBOAT superfamily)
MTEPVETEEVEEELGEALPPAPPRPAKQRAARLWRATNRGPMRWVKKIIQFPIGERFAAIAITAAFFDARTVFIVLLAWGGFAMLYVLLGRMARSMLS